MWYKCGEVYVAMALHSVLLVLAFAVCVVTGQYCVPSGCTSADIDYGYIPVARSGDSFYLGSLFSIHQPGETSYQCGPIDTVGVQQLEAFLWTVKNYKSVMYDILSGVDVGALTFDTCGGPGRALQQVLNIETCTVNYGQPGGAPIEPKYILGYVGPTHHSVAQQVAPVLGGMGKTLIGPAPATAPDDVYTHYLRTSPDTWHQAKALLLTVKALGWNYTQLVYSPDAYGRRMKEVFTAAAAEQGVCVVNMQELAESGQAQTVIDSLLEHAATRSVAVFVSDLAAVRTLLRLQQAMIRGEQGKFTWLGDVKLGHSLSTLTGMEQALADSLLLQYQDGAPGLQDFKQYYRQLKPDHSTENPWFKEFWMTVFSCDLPGETSLYNMNCDTTVQSLQASDLDPSVTLVIRATLAMLQGIDNAWVEQCGFGASGLCSSFMSHANRAAILHAKLRSLNLTELAVFHPITGESLSTRYNILNYQAAQVGVYDVSIQRVQLQADMLQIDTTSTCSHNPCSVCGEKYKPPPTTPSPSGALLVDGSVVQLREGIWVIVLLVLASLGIFLVVMFEIFTLCQICGRAGLGSAWRSMWLGQLLLLAVFLSYCSLLAFLPVPNLYTCAVIRIAVGCCYAMIFSVLLVKLMIILSSKTYGHLQGIFQVLMFFFAWSLQNYCTCSRNVVWQTSLCWTSVSEAVTSAACVTLVVTPGGRMISHSTSTTT